VYHLGNNPYHGFVYEAALQRPGVAVFHELVLHHLVSHLMVEGLRQPERYIRVMTDEYGEAGTRLADLRFRGVATDLEKFVFPLTGHVARGAAVIVVHSKDAREEMERIAPGVPVSVIPHHAGAPPKEVRGIGRAEARAALGLPAEAFLVGHFGFITRPKHPAAVIAGFGRLAARRPDARLLLVGADHSGGGLDLLIERQGLRNRVILAGFVDMARFYLYVKAVDAVVNLRYPSAGETSGTLTRALAEGRPLVVNRVGSFAELPDDIALKVEVDEDQAEGVGRELVRLASDQELRRHMEGEAGRYAATILDPRRCRDLYVEAALIAAG
jgi:glycosyltransferase involved in cell wall biosynthesis